ncbi:MAG: hypothetical protein JWR32_1374 [Mycobacterium sp.]|nr:hypothetical protein [Mycobacterium sp.]
MSARRGIWPRVVLALVCALLGIGGWDQPAVVDPAPPNGTGLTLHLDGPTQFAVGEQVLLTPTVPNGTAGVCRVVTDSTSTVVITAVERDGKQVYPLVSRILPFTEIPSPVADVAAGGTTRLAAMTAPYGAMEVWSSADRGAKIIAGWDVSQRLDDPGQFPTLFCGGLGPERIASTGEHSLTVFAFDRPTGDFEFTPSLR